MEKMKITFELSVSDVKHFRQLLKDSSAAANKLGEAKVIAAAEKVLVEVEAFDPTEFVGARMGSLRQMIDMMKDSDFALASDLRGRVVTGLAYFADPQDIIADRIPGLGFLDDAIMIELVRRDLQPELDAYESFCKSRDERQKDRKRDTEGDADFLADKRRKLFERIRTRRAESRSRSRKRSSFRVF